MELFLITLVIIALCVFGMCFNIIFRKNGEFPQYEVGSNEQMRRRGIKCVRQEEAERLAREAARRGGSSTDIKIDCDESCSDCRQAQCR